MPTTRDYLIATLMGENNGGSAQSLQGILDTIYNRAADPGGYGAASSSIADVVQGRTPNGGYQYNAWSPSDNSYSRLQRALSGNPQSGGEATQYADAARTVDNFQNFGIGRGISQGSTFYQTATAPNAWQRTSLWPKYGNIVVGDHIYSGPGLVTDKTAYLQQHPEFNTAPLPPSRPDALLGGNLGDATDTFDPSTSRPFLDQAAITRSGLTISPTDFVQSFSAAQGAPGAQTFGSAYGPGDLVDAAYHEYLNRDAQAEERGYWTDRIGQPGTNLTGIIGQIAASPEANAQRAANGIGAYGFSNAAIGTANGIGNASPDGLGAWGPIVTAGLDTSLPTLGPLSGVSTAGLGMNGATDGANGARYGDAAVPAQAPTALPTFDPYAPAGLDTTLSGLSPLAPASTSGLGMNGQTDASNSARYGSNDVTPATPDGLGTYGPISTAGLDTSLPATPPLAPVPTNDLFGTPNLSGIPAVADAASADPGVGPYAFASHGVPTAAPGFVDPSSLDTRQGLINSLYQRDLGRNADTGGLDYWNQQLAGGLQSLSGINSAIRGSSEGQAFAGANPGASFASPTMVDDLYAMELGRAPDSQGRSYWQSQIDAGTPVSQIAGQIAGSDEGQAYASDLGRSPYTYLQGFEGLGLPSISGGVGGPLFYNPNPALSNQTSSIDGSNLGSVDGNSAARSRLMANDAANVANNAFLTGSNAFNTAQSNDLSLASVPGPVHGDATGDGAALNNISLQLANERAAIAKLPVAPTAAPVQASFYGQQPTANSRSLFGTGLPPGAGFL